MYLTVSSEKGRFNLLEPSEESIRTRINLIDEDGKLLRHTSVATDYEETDASPENVIDMIKRYDQSLLYYTNRDKDREFVQFIKDNLEELELSSYRRELINLERKQKEVSTRIKYVKEMIEIKNGEKNNDT